MKEKGTLVSLETGLAIKAALEAQISEGTLVAGEIPSLALRVLSDNLSFTIS